MASVLIIVGLSCWIAASVPQRAKDSLWGVFWGLLLLAFVLGTAASLLQGRAAELATGPFDY